jgi:signal transduction histidine kinase
MGPVNILMVDDQPAKLLSYEAMLGELGENLIKANTAREALAALLQEEVAVILMDVSMPEIDGFELAALVRQHPRCQRTAIIFVSAIHLSDLDRVKGYEAGAVDYVSVPVIPEILRAKIRVFIELHRKTAELKELNDELEERVRSRTNELEASLERLRESETRLRLQGEELVEAGHRKDEFLAMLGHELRNPLAPIRNAVEIIRRGSDRSPALESVSDIVDRQVTHLARLVDDLLDASRISRGKMVLSRSTVELNRLLAEAIESVRPVDNGGHNLSVSLPQTPIYVDADPVRLTQVLVNLLGNAIKFTPKGGRIWLSAAATTDQVEISVQDTGQGIDPADLDHIFDMFYQGRAAAGRDRGGLGLGLTLVRTLVEMHAGTVAVDSSGLAQGSRFVVRLPRMTSSTKTELYDPPALAIPMAQSRRVLVVDDNCDAAESLAMLLRMDGAEVEVAFDGEAAVNAVSRFQPDVILLDIGLPKMDGYTAARTIRREPFGRNTLLVAMTGWGQAEDKRRAMEAGFDAHLVKPVSMDALMDIFASLRLPA